VISQRTRNAIAAELRKAQYLLENSKEANALDAVRDVLIEQLYRVSAKTPEKTPEVPT